MTAKNELIKLQIEKLQEQLKQLNDMSESIGPDKNIVEAYKYIENMILDLGGELEEGE